MTMHTVRSYTHPLSGSVHDSAASLPPDGSGGGRLLVLAVLALALLLGCAVAGGGCAVYKFRDRARQAQEALRQANGAIEYEPLSTVSDGSYTEEAGGGRPRSLGVLNRLRSRLR